MLVSYQNCVLGQELFCVKNPFLTTHTIPLLKRLWCVNLYTINVRSITHRRNETYFSVKIYYVLNFRQKVCKFNTPF